MSEVFWASYVALWMTSVLLAALTVEMAKRLKPPPRTLGRQDQGLAIGQPFPVMRLTTLGGDTIDLSRKPPASTIVLFTSPGCQACEMVYPHLSGFPKRRPSVQIIAFMVGEPARVAEVAARWALDVPVVRLAHSDLEQFQTLVFPFAYFLSPEGVVLAKGVVNNDDHLELLAQAASRSNRPAQAG